MINPNSFVQNNDVKDIDCDYLVVGSGAGGSVASYELSMKKKDVLLIEEGKFFEINKFKGSFKNSLQAWRNGGFTPVIGSPSFDYGHYTIQGSSYLGKKIYRDKWLIIK